MRVLLLARSLGIGGAERQLCLTARLLRNRGHDVAVAVFYGGGPLEDELTEAGIPLLVIGKCGRWDLFGFLYRLVGALRGWRPDVLYAFLSVPNLLAALLRPTLRGCRIVFGVRASDMDLSQYDRLAAMSYRLEGLLAHCADLVIANSWAGRTAAEIRGFPAGCIQVVPNGVDLDRFRPDPERRAAQRAAWGIPAGARLIGMVARLDPMKGHDVFLAAAARMAEADQSLWFVCVGDGPEERKAVLRQGGAVAGLAERFVVVGTGDPVAVFNALDLLVLASSWGEGFPNVLAEAMACGIPCLATDVGDAALVLGDVGEVVPPGDAVALAAAALRRLDGSNPNPALLRERVIHLFSAEALGEATERLLQNLLRPAVLHLITGLGCGGAERMLAQIATDKDPTAPRQLVASMTGAGHWGATLAQAGVPVLDLGMRRGIVSPTALWLLLMILRRERPALLMTWLYHADLLGTLAWMLTGCRGRLVWNLRCSAMDLELYGRSARVARRLLTWLSPLPDAIVANSAAGKAAHAALGYRPRRWVILPNGIDTGAFRTDADQRRRIRAELGLEEDQVAVGMVARVDPMKDHATLFAAMAVLLKSLPQTVLVLAGAGVPELTPELPATAVRLLPMRDDVAGLMVGLDVLVMSSAFGEGFPNAVAEGMACGLPCVVTDVGDAVALVGPTGRVVPPQVPEAMAAAIATLATDASLRRRLGEEARSRITALFSLDAARTAYRSFFHTP